MKTPNIQKSKIPSKTKKNSKNQDLAERFENFFIRVIILCRKSPLNARTSRIISQLTGCSGSIPANFAEATEAMSKKDFTKSIKICRKEAKESKVWLKGLKSAVNFKNKEFDNLTQEATEFIYIFTSILKKTDN